MCTGGSSRPWVLLSCRWFHDTLVDGDLAINSMMWQVRGMHAVPLPMSCDPRPCGRAAGFASYCIVKAVLL